MSDSHFKFLCAACTLEKYLNLLMVYMPLFFFLVYFHRYRAERRGRCRDTAERSIWHGTGPGQEPHATRVWWHTSSWKGIVHIILSCFPVFRYVLWSFCVVLLIYRYGCKRQKNSIACCLRALKDESWVKAHEFTICKWCVCGFVCVCIRMTLSILSFY